MDKINCVMAEDGTIIPLHSITLVSIKDGAPYIFVSGNGYYELSDEQYNALLNEIEFID